jgi:hypothetical protein
MTLKQWSRCALACALTVSIVSGLYGFKTSAQSHPSSLQRLDESDLNYLGGFRVPGDAIAGTNFTYGGGPIAFNPANRSLFVGSSDGKVAEISIPAPLNTADPKAMPVATYLQPAFIDPTEGHRHEVSSSDVVLYGLMVHDNRLVGATSIYYDARYSQKLSHFARPLSLLERRFSGWSEVGETGRSGLVSGWMSAVPAEWQSELGGPAITGQCCIPIITRTSYGPSAFAFDPSRVGQPTVPAQPLLYYDSAHPTLGQWEDSNATYGMATRVGGVAIIAGTRTALFVGSNGLGPACYGAGTANQALADASEEFCYDPTDSNKGVHAYPYRYQVWAYDLNDFAAVKAGTKQPWEVLPYGVWPLTFPTAAPQLLIGGVGYDPHNQTLYVSQRHADQGEFTLSPIIHAFKLDVETRMNPVTALTISANRNAPQKVGATVTFSAEASGGDAPNQFKWLVLENGAWQVRSDWSTASTFAWTAATANPQYQVAVWARSGKSDVDRAQAHASMRFPIEDASDANPVSAVTLSANRAAPQQPGTAITFTASASGGTGRNNQYKWLLFNGSGWATLANWSAAGTFTWTPSSANSQYQVQVWARNAVSALDQPQAHATVRFPIEPPAVIAAPVSSVNVKGTVSPQRVGTALSFVATPHGGAGPHQFKWRTFDGATWTVRADWGTSNRFSWTPPAANTGYRIEVWVRSAGNKADAAEASLGVPFVITP